MAPRAGDNAKHLRENAEYFRMLARYNTNPKMLEAIADLVAEFETLANQDEAKQRARESKT